MMMMIRIHFGSSLATYAGAELDPWRSFHMTMAAPKFLLSWLQGIFDGFQPYLKVSVSVAIGLVVYDNVFGMRFKKRLSLSLDDCIDRLYYLEQYHSYLAEMWNSRARLKLIMHPDNLHRLKKKDLPETGRQIRLLAVIRNPQFQPDQFDDDGNLKDNVDPRQQTQFVTMPFTLFKDGVMELSEEKWMWYPERRKWYGESDSESDHDGT